MLRTAVSYSPTEKALYLSVAVGTAMMILVVSMNYSRTLDDIITFSFPTGTFNAVKLPAQPYKQIQIDGYKFRWFQQDPKEVILMCDIINIKVTSPDGQEYTFRSCKYVAEEKFEFYPILYEGEDFGYAYNWKEKQGYFVVRLSDNTTPGIEWCPNPDIDSRDGDTFVVCLNPEGLQELGPFRLPPPVYKKVPCTSMFGCSQDYNYIEQIPQNLLTQEQKQQVINKVVNETEIKAWPWHWELEHFIISPRTDRWFADIEFFVPEYREISPINRGECGWYSSVGIDLQTLELTYKHNTNVTEYTKCQ